MLSSFFWRGRSCQFKAFGTIRRHPQLASCGNIINALQGLVTETCQPYLEAVCQCRPPLRYCWFKPAANDGEKVIYFNAGKRVRKRQTFIKLMKQWNQLVGHSKNVYHGLFWTALHMKWLGLQWQCRGSSCQGHHFRMGEHSRQEGRSILFKHRCSTLQACFAHQMCLGHRYSECDQRQQRNLTIKSPFFVVRLPVNIIQTRTQVAGN